MARTVAALAAFAICLAVPLAAQTQERLEAQRKSLEMIKDMASSICNEVSLKGEAESYEVQGEIEAKLRGLASRLADLGVSGSGQVASQNYRNVLQEDLAATLRDNAACKLRVFETLHGTLAGLETRPASTTAARPAPSRPRPMANLATAEAGGLSAMVSSVLPSNNFRNVTLLIVLRNVADRPLLLFGMSQGIRGVADNGAQYIAGPAGLVGIGNCRANYASCPATIRRAEVEGTELQPREEVQLQVNLYRHANQRGEGRVSALSALSLPLYLSLADASAGTGARNVVLNFGTIDFP